MEVGGRVVETETGGVGEKVPIAGELVEGLGERGGAEHGEAGEAEMGGLDMGAEMEAQSGIGGELDGGQPEAIEGSTVGVKVGQSELGGGEIGVAAEVGRGNAEGGQLVGEVAGKNDGKVCLGHESIFLVRKNSF